ncbi:MAG: hypothetical protein ACKPKO_64330, partial [Candidatus Fonsibacter sp.]
YFPRLLLRKRCYEGKRIARNVLMDTFRATNDLHGDERQRGQRQQGVGTRKLNTPERVMAAAVETSSKCARHIASLRY